MIRIHKLQSNTANTANLPSTVRACVLWTLGNLCMWIGLVILLYVGGVYASAEYGRYAARGDNDEPVPPPLSVSQDPEGVGLGTVLFTEPAPFVPAVLNTQSILSADQESVTTVAHTPQGAESSITRIAIPAIDIDAKVVPVGWDIVEKNGQQYAVWQVAQYAVGHHKDSANPGDGSNIVLAGHVGGYGKVFKDLIKLQAGDPITLYSNNQQYLYIVDSQLLVTEEGVSLEQQAENARYIAPTNSEVVTMITCWPATGPKRFSQRVIVRAIPFSDTQTYQTYGLAPWTIK